MDISPSLKSIPGFDNLSFCLFREYLQERFYKVQQYSDLCLSLLLLFKQSTSVLSLNLQINYGDDDIGEDDDANDGDVDEGDLLALCSCNMLIRMIKCMTLMMAMMMMTAVQHKYIQMPSLYLFCLAQFLLLTLKL